ncbi:MAG TPA: MFS transporter, partial [Acidimicrobiales bacterium]|nr:MFS transporter [Acidimicrobiales bacterium]
MARLVADIKPLRRHRAFRRLWFGQLVSSTGSQLTVVAVSFQAFVLTRSTLVVGLVSLAQLVPLVLGSIGGGIIADATDRRRITMGCQVLSATSSGGLVANALVPHPAVWPLFVCTGALAALQGADQAARRAALPMIVPAEDVTSAVALQTVMFQCALVVGPALGGLLIATIGLGSVYGIDVASFGASFTAAALLPSLVPSGGGTPVGFKSLVEGLQYLRRERLLAGSYWIDLNAMIFGMPRAVFPALGTGIFGGGAGTVGLLYAAPGAGSLIGSLLTGWVSGVRRRGRAVVFSVAVWGATITLFGFTKVLWGALLLLALAGAADVISAVFRQAILQTTTPEHLQGRLSGTFFAVVAGGPRLGDLETGAAAAIAGPEFAVWSGGLACLAGIGVVLWR